MKRFVLTGAPGAGKTAIIRQLELDGFSVVEEAATDVIALEQAKGIAEPWTHSSFIDSVADLRRKRLLRASREPDEAPFPRSVRRLHCCSGGLSWISGLRRTCTRTGADQYGGNLSKAGFLHTESWLHQADRSA